MRAPALAVLVWLGASGQVAAQLTEISNYREYTPGFSSSGQPTEAQLEALRDEGFERIIYIAFSNDRNAVPNEDRIVRDLGMDYLHLPVVFDAPEPSDFAAFASVMQAEPDKKTLLHCQVNFRASAFSFLYRVIHGGVSLSEAKADMDSVWRPNEIWRSFIFTVLEQHGLSPNCAGCDWEIGE